MGKISKLRLDKPAPEKTAAATAGVSSAELAVLAGKKSSPVPKDPPKPSSKRRQ